MQSYKNVSQGKRCGTPLSGFARCRLAEEEDVFVEEEDEAHAGVRRPGCPPSTPSADG